jgi:hypothetical protein
MNPPNRASPLAGEPSSQTLIDRLRAPAGEAERQRLLVATEELHLRLLAALRSGAPREHFEALQAASLAVQACRATLQRIRAPQAPG